MKKTFNIWIPSIQKYLRFNELNVNEYCILLKSLSDSDTDFSYTLNSIIENNIIDKNYNYKLLTTLDRFIIFLALKIHSYGAFIVLSNKCEKCDTISSIKMDLNILVDNLGQRIDKCFSKHIKENDIIIECDLPTIETDQKISEYSALYNLNKSSIDFSLNNYILSHIKTIKIKDKLINFNALEYENKIQIINKLPAKVIERIKKEFLVEIHNLVADLDFLTIKCSKEKCESELEIKFNINNINDLVKILYKDSSIESIMNEIVYINVHTHVGGNYLNEIAPIEMNKIFNDLQKQQKESASENNMDNKEKDMFAESPSEFSNL